MPSHTPVASAGSRGGHPLLFPGVALTPPGGWCPRLYEAGFLLSSREGPKRKRNLWSLPGMGPTYSPSSGEQLQGCEGSYPGRGMLNLYATRGTYILETRKERKRENISSHQNSCPQGSDPPMSLFSAKEQGRPPQLAREASWRPACNSLLPADLGLLHRSQIGVIDDVLLPIPAPRQGGVLLQDRSILLLGSRIIL